MWIATLLTHLFCNTGYNTVLRHAASGKKNDPIFLATLMSTAVAAPGVVGIFIADIDWSAFNAPILLMYAATLACAVLFHIINAKALEITEASVFIFLYNFRIGIAALLGVTFLGELAVPLSLAGGVLVFAAGLILVGKSTAPPTGVMFSIAAAALVAVLNAMEKYLISEIGYAAYAFPSTVITAAILWAIMLAGKRPIDKPFLKTGAFRALMVFRCLSAYGFTLSLAFGALLSVATYISALSCVTTPIAAIIFLKEKDNLVKKTIAGIVALAGVTLIFIAG
ncbi:MAG: hypothetical protein FWH32_06630 [Clostridiales bacterium]|nr:hypothetical protein [Clostridiales bacterium]